METITAGPVPAREELRPSERVVEAVAALEGREPVDLDPPLYAAIDPDALDSLFADAEPCGGCSVSFVYRGHDVVVDCDGTVRIGGR